LDFAGDYGAVVVAVFAAVDLAAVGGAGFVFGVVIHFLFSEYMRGLSLKILTRERIIMTLQ
jgi:hypothetical protein